MWPALTAIAYLTSPDMIDLAEPTTPLIGQEERLCNVQLYHGNEVAFEVSLAIVGGEDLLLIAQMFFLTNPWVQGSLTCEPT